jgi:hypothetical protein
VPESEEMDSDEPTLPFIEPLKISTTTQPVFLRFTRPVEDREYPTPTSAQEIKKDPSPTTYPQSHKLDPDALFSDDGSIFSDDDDIELIIPPPRKVIPPPRKRVRTKYRAVVKRVELVERDYFTLPIEPRKKRGRPRINPLYTVCSSKP